MSDDHADDAALVDEALQEALLADAHRDSPRGLSRGDRTRAMALRTAEGVARVAVTAGLSLVRVVLHAPVERLTQQSQMDVAGLAAELVGASARTLRNRGLSRPEMEMTGEALVTALRLATQLSSPTLGVAPQAMFDAGKAYVLLQSYGSTLSGANALAAIRDEAADALAAKQAQEQTQRQAQQQQAPQRTSLRSLLKRFSWRRDDGPAPPPAPPVAALERGARHAFATYGKMGGQFMDALARVQTDTEALEYLTGARTDPSKEVVVCHWPSNLVGSLYRVGHYVLVDHAEKEITLAVRGSFGIQDVLTDLVADDVAFDVPADLDALLQETEAETAAEAAVRRSPRTGHSELDALFRDLSQALRGVRDRLDSNGDLLRLQQTLQEWANRRGDGALAEEEAAEIEQLERSARSEADAVEDGRAKNRTHLGFLRTAKRLAVEVEEVLAGTVRKHASYKLILVGHSLGAAVCTLLTFMWAKHPQLRKAECLGIAAPCSLSLDMAASPLAMRKIHNVVLSDDVVPRLSLGSVTDVRDSIVYIARNHITADVLAAVADPTRNDPETLRELFTPIYERVAAATHKRHKLYPAGNTWHIRDINDTIQSAVLMPPQTFGTLVLSRYMFVAHLPNYYAHACKLQGPDEPAAAEEEEQDGA